VYFAIVVLRPSAATRHLMWWLVIAVAAMVPLASFSASLGRVRTMERPPVAAPLRTILRDNAPDRAELVPEERAPVARAPIPVTIAIGAKATFGALLGLWISVAAYKGASLLLELAALGRVKRRARPLDGAIVAMLGAWREHGARGRRASLAVSDDVAVPCAAGLWSPAILLPVGLVDRTAAADLDRIALHEFAHLWRFDDWTNLAERIVGAVLWFNPAVALAKKRIAIDREIACDDWVVARIGGAHGYASCLFRLAEATASRVKGNNVHALGALGGTNRVTERIEHLLGRTYVRRPVARTLVAGVGALALALVVSQAMRAPAIAVEEASAPQAPLPPVASAANANASATPRVPAVPRASVAAHAKTRPESRYIIRVVGPVTRLPSTPPLPPVLPPTRQVATRHAKGTASVDTHDRDLAAAEARLSAAADRLAEVEVRQAIAALKSARNVPNDARLRVELQHAQSEELAAEANMRDRATTQALREAKRETEALKRELSQAGLHGARAELEQLGPSLRSELRGELRAVDMQTLARTNAVAIKRAMEELRAEFGRQSQP